MTGDAGRAVERGLAFLASSQLGDGAFNVFASTDPTLATGCTPDPSVFPTALIAHSLSFSEGAGAIRERAFGFLLAEMDRNGLWRHWTRDHPHSSELPPDLDDTSCASAVLEQAGRQFRANRPLLLANRNKRGLFHTWVAPRPRWTGMAHMKIVLAQLRHAPTLAMFFRKTSAAPGDVDAVVNANTLHYLGRRAETENVVAWLLDILAEGREESCDKWYDSRLAVWYFMSRALSSSAPEAGAPIARHILASSPSTALELALAICGLNYWRQPVPELFVERLLEAQRSDGAWPRGPLYHGGRERKPDGSFAQPHPDTPRWGSEELTTAFCIEALSRCANG